jgi:hypothetical protein
MKTFDLPEFERSVSQLALELTPRQRYLCSILIIRNPVVTESLRAILMQALDIDEAPDFNDPVCQAVLALGYGKEINLGNQQIKNALTVLRSLGVMPDLFTSIRFIQALSALTTGAIR